MDNSQNNITKSKGTILFIDDEHLFLKAIKRIFILTEINILTATNSTNSLEILSRENVDIVITDYRMPETDGMKLLQQIKKKYPSILRIIFSGFIDNELLLRAVNAGWALTFFSKPWDNEKFKEKIISLLILINDIHDKELLIKINSVHLIPTINNHYIQVNEMIKQNKTVNYFVKIIHKDPAMAVVILKTVNTLLYGEKKITSIYQALSLLTFQNLNNIMINMNSVEHLGWEEARIKEIKRLFYFSRLLNKYIPLLYKFETGKIPDNFFPDYGIIYYIGRILLLLLFPERYNDILEYLGNNPGKSFSESESALDPKHVSAEFLGILILKLWNIPEELYEVIMNTSHPEKLNKKNNEIINLIHNIHKFITYLWQNKFTGKVKLSEIGFKTIPTDKLKSIIVEITEDMKSYK